MPDAAFQHSVHEGQSGISLTGDWTLAHLPTPLADFEQRLHQSAVRATFWDLCARPLGPGDFLALAAACRVLILEDIPQLSASNFNEAKRFVTLIDALYEGKVRLICSAADIPERLYIEGEGAFEFERTASRLREMQAADWAADRA